MNNKRLIEAGALRQYISNSGDGPYIAAWDLEITNRVVAHLEAQLLAAQPAEGSRIVPHKLGYPTPASDSDAAYTNGWNDCRATMLGEIPDDPSNLPAEGSAQVAMEVIADRQYLDGFDAGFMAGEAGDHDQRAAVHTSRRAEIREALATPAAVVRAAPADWRKLAARACENESVDDSTLTEGDVAYNMAIRHCKAAILALPDIAAEGATQAGETPRAKQEKLCALADRIDHEKLWTRPMMYRDRMTDDQRDRLDAGVMLRRYSDLLAPGRWLLIPPTGSIQFSAGTFNKVMEMARRDAARIDGDKQATPTIQLQTGDAK